MSKSRRITTYVEKDLQKKMVLLAGPRQCGKTTLANQLIERIGGEYYSWDVDEHRRLIRNSMLSEGAKLWVLDELHKNRHWRNWLKGQFDLHHKEHQILVTGSARLDLYSRGGDSLQGRYFLCRLHPFTFGEFSGFATLEDLDLIPKLPYDPPQGARAVLQDMMQLGSFPEPLLSGSQQEADRWRLAYSSRVIQEEVRSLEQIRDLDKMQMLFERLPATVSSVLSLNSLREDLEVAFETVRNWIAVFERMYFCFRIAPFGPPRLKAVKKEQKLYLWDWCYAQEPSQRFENLIALHLLRLQHWCEDIHGQSTELRYFRTTLGHEVDFVLLRNRKPWIVVEAKLSEQPLDRNLKYFLERVKVPYAFQVHLHGTKDYRVEDINGCQVRILPAEKLLANLP